MYYVINDESKERVKEREEEGRKNLFCMCVMYVFVINDKREEGRKEERKKKFICMYCVL